MDRNANPTTILHVLIPIPIRLNLIALFHEYDNRIVLCNVAPLFQDRYGFALDPIAYGCLNVNQLFTSMKHLFYFHQQNEVIYVNCYIKIGSVKLVKKKENKISLDLSFLENISFLFEPNDFNVIRYILRQSLARNMPLSISQFEQEFITLASYAFNYQKYGFKSLGDLFIIFSELFEMFDQVGQNSEDSPEEAEKSYAVKSSLGDIMVILKLPTIKS